jgi:glutathione S-transferase
MVFYQTSGAPLSEAAQRSAHKLIDVAEQLIPAGATTAFDEWSVADADLALALRRIAGDGDLLPARLHEYAVIQWARPSVRAYVEHPREPFVPYGSAV